MNNVISAGGIVSKKENGIIKICLVNLDLSPDKFVFPKGHQEQGEKLEETALREVYEEIGLTNLSIVKYLGMFTRKATERNGKIVNKDIYIYLMSTNDCVHQKSEEKYQWFSIDEAVNVMLPEEAKFLESNRKGIENLNLL